VFFSILGERLWLLKDMRGQPGRGAGSPGIALSGGTPLTTGAPTVEASIPERRGVNMNRRVRHRPSVLSVVTLFTCAAFIAAVTTGVEAPGTAAAQGQVSGRSVTFSPTGGLAAGAGSTTQTSTPLAWSEWGYNAGGDFFAGGDTTISSSNIAKMAEAWTAGDHCGPFDGGIGPTDNGISPVIGQNVVYYSTCDTVVAASVATGDTLWSASLSPFTAPALAGGRVFVGTTSGQLVALSAATGATLWSTSLASAQMSDPTLDGSSVVVSDGPSVYKVSQSTGAVIWTFTCSASGLPIGQTLCNTFADVRDLSAPVTASSDVYLASTGFTFELTAKGQLGWYTPNSENTYFSNPIVVGGIVYSGSESETAASELQAFNASSGVVIWQQDNAWSGGDIALANGTIYDTNGYSVEAWNASTGAPIWNAGGCCSSGISAVGNLVFYNWGALNAATGATLWTNPVGCATPVTIFKGYLFCGAGNPEYLVAFHLTKKRSTP